MRARYILLKDSPELKKGAILEEQCDDGTQGFISIRKSDVKFKDNGEESWYSRKTIMKNPSWFKEVVSIYLTSEELKKVKKFLKKGK